MKVTKSSVYNVQLYLEDSKSVDILWVCDSNMVDKRNTLSNECKKIVGKMWRGHKIYDYWFYYHFDCPKGMYHSDEIFSTNNT